MPRPVSNPIVVRRRARPAPLAVPTAEYPMAELVPEKDARQQLINLNPPSFLSRAMVYNRTGFDNLAVELNPQTDGTLQVVLRLR